MKRYAVLFGAFLLGQPLAAQAASDPKAEVSHCGYDAFHFVRKAGKWRILNVSDTFRQSGCGEAWPKE